MIFSIGDAMNFERKKYKGTKTKEGPWLSPVVLLSHGSFFIWRTAVDVKCDGTRFAPTLDPVLATGSELQFPTLAPWRRPEVQARRVLAHERPARIRRETQEEEAAHRDRDAVRAHRELVRHRLAAPRARVRRFSYAVGLPMVARRLLGASPFSDALRD